MDRRHFFKIIALGSMGAIIPSSKHINPNEKISDFSLVHFRIKGKEYGAKILMDGVENKEKILDYMDLLYSAGLRKAEKVLNGI